MDAFHGHKDFLENYVVKNNQLVDLAVYHLVFLIIMGVRKLFPCVFNKSSPYKLSDTKGARFSCLAKKYGYLNLDLERVPPFQLCMQKERIKITAKL